MQKLIYLISSHYSLIFLFTVCILASFIIYLYSWPFGQNHFTDLAASFLQGKLDVTETFNSSYFADIATYKDRYYVYFGPTPAILLLPFVFFLGNTFSQHLLGLTFISIDFYLLYQINKKLSLNTNTTLWLCIFFIFGTVLTQLTLLNISSYQTQVIATSLLIMALYEFFHKKRWLIMGIFIALAGVTRFTLYLSAVFFLLEIFLLPLSLKNKLIKFSLFLTPIILSLILFGFYNYARFDNPFNSGYNYAASLNNTLQNSSLKSFFSLEYIPGNLYFLLLKGPDAIQKQDSNFLLTTPYLKANYWGMGIFFTSPLFVYLFLTKLKEKYILTSWITVSIMIIPIITYFGIGLWQFGYRYAVDFYPFLFIILATIFKNRLPTRAKILIILGLIFNYYLMLSVWNIYPFQIRY